MPALTDVKVRNTQPTGKPFKVYDSGGLFLQVTATGSKLWRMKYKLDGREKLLSFGKYPAWSLKEAREQRDAARLMLDRKVDPAEAKRTHKAEVHAKAAESQRAATTFKDVASEWLALQLPHWAESHGQRQVRRFEADVYPYLGSMAVADITPAAILAMAQRIQERGSIETAHRVKQKVGQVLRFAVGKGLIETDATQPLQGQLERVPRARHFAAPIDPKELGAVLRAIDGYHGSPVVRAALKLTPLLAVRPGELRQARWADIDLDQARWSFEASKTKRPHIVPLADAARQILQDLHILTGHGTYVFPSPRYPDGSRPISDNALLVALRTMGIAKETASLHGFRATFRTLADEALRARIEVIELQLAHNVGDPLGRAYNRTAFIEERTELMALWASYLDSIKSTLSNPTL